MGLSRDYQGDYYQESYLSANSSPEIIEIRRDSIFKYSPRNYGVDTLWASSKSDRLLFLLDLNFENNDLLYYTAEADFDIDEKGWEANWERAVYKKYEED